MSIEDGADCQVPICCESSSSSSDSSTSSRIDLMYLDGPHPDREDGRRWHFEAYQAAPMNHRGIVLIDDTDLPRLGKAEFVVPAALEDGFQVVASDRQTLLVR